MEMTWGYAWGLWWWRQTGKNMNPDRLRTDLAAIPAANVTGEELKKANVRSLRDRGLANGIPQCIPTDIVTTGVRPHVQNSRIVVHQWNGFIPLGSICESGANYFICSPELCLLQSPQSEANGIHHPQTVPIHSDTHRAGMRALRYLLEAKHNNGFQRAE